MLDIDKYMLIEPHLKLIWVQINFLNYKSEYKVWIQNYGAISEKLLCAIIGNDKFYIFRDKLIGWTFSELNIIIGMNLLYKNKFIGKTVHWFLCKLNWLVQNEWYK